MPSPRDAGALPQSATADPLADWPANLASLGVRSRLEAGDSLFLRGRLPTHVFWVESGEIHLQRASPHGRILILQRVREGFVAEASLQATSYHCDAVAGQSSAIWRFPRGPVLEALHGSTEFAMWWARRLAEQLRSARLRLERLSLKGASERILHAIETEGSGGRLRLASTRQAWAAELGLTAEALYRSLAQLQRKGVVRIRGSELRLVEESTAAS